MIETRSNIIEQTYKQQRGRLLGFIRKNVKLKEDAEDIFQDVIYQFISFYDEVDTIEQISAWLFKAAKNKIIDLYRKKKSTALSDEVIISVRKHGDEPLMLEDILTDLSNKPDDIYWKSLVWEEIENALNKLPNGQREVFIMHEFEDMSFKEISVITGKPVNTLISRKRYAVLFLRKELKKLYKENEK